MKKILFIGGIAAIGYAFFSYFKDQLNLVLDWGYNLKDVRINKLTTSGADLTFIVALTNKSSFKVDVLSYDLKFSYKGKQVSSAKSNESFTILPAATFDVRADGYLDFTTSKTVLMPLAKDVLEKKPLSVQVDGVVNLRFLGIDSKVELKQDTYTYSEDVLSEINARDKVDSAYTKAQNFLGKLGIKV